MDYKSIFRRFLTSAKWQTSKSWFGAFARFACCLSSTACLCDIVNCESFINCLPSWDIFILISMQPTPFSNIWSLHLCNAFSPQPATLDIWTLGMLSQSSLWNGKLPDVDKNVLFEMSCSLISLWIRVYFFGIINFHQKMSPKYQRAQKWLPQADSRAQQIPPTIEEYSAVHKFISKTSFTAVVHTRYRAAASEGSETLFKKCVQ